jgi:hypothetical protein
VSIELETASAVLTPVIGLIAILYDSVTTVEGCQLWFVVVRERHVVGVRSCVKLSGTSVRVAIHHVILMSTALC